MDEIILLTFASSGRGYIVWQRILARAHRGHFDRSRIGGRPPGNRNKPTFPSQGGARHLEVPRAVAPGSWPLWRQRLLQLRLDL